MRIKKVLSIAVLTGCLLCLGAKPADSKKENVNQCGVSNSQIADYLRTCSHHHTVYSVSDISGTCNSLAQIEGCSTATVYVESGIIIGHLDNNGYCD